LSQQREIGLDLTPVNGYERFNASFVDGHADNFSKSRFRDYTIHGQ
ncbi:MAG: hypothetical protein HN406_18280, partial [Lentisphaerae bacterium]|nr:hypothetical protein [Lentisphaerota bacterium]